MQCSKITCQHIGSWLYGCLLKMIIFGSDRGLASNMHQTVVWTADSLGYCYWCVLCVTWPQWVNGPICENLVPCKRDHDYPNVNISSGEKHILNPNATGIDNKSSGLSPTVTFVIPWQFTPGGRISKWKYLITWLRSLQMVCVSVCTHPHTPTTCGLWGPTTESLCKLCYFHVWNACRSCPGCFREPHWY